MADARGAGRGRSIIDDEGDVEAELPLVVALGHFISGMCFHNLYALSVFFSFNALLNWILYTIYSIYGFQIA